MKNLFETVNYFEDIIRFDKIKTSVNIEDINEIKDITKRINCYTQINYSLLEDLEDTNFYVKNICPERELVICIKDLIYSVGSEDQNRIDIKINEGDCYYTTDFGHDTVMIKSINGVSIRMKKSTFRYYFGVIDAKGRTIKEFYSSKIFREMDDDENWWNWKNLYR